MPAINEVQVSQAVANNRFSAEFFDPKYVFEPLSGADWRPIGRILTKCEYGLSIAMNTEGRGYPMFRMNEINNCFALRPAKHAGISRSLFDEYSLKENDVLFNRTNSFDFVGRTGIVKDQTDCTFASYLIRLVPNASILLPEYLTVYLNTPFGIGQVKRRAMRSINQANVSGSEIRKVLIPVLEMRVQESIAEMVNTAYRLNRESKTNVENATELLNGQLGLDRFVFRKPVGYVSTFSKLSVSRRLDAEHFYPMFKSLVAALPKKIKLTRIGELVSYCQRGKQPTYSPVGMRVINSKHVQPNRVVLRGNRFGRQPIDPSQEIRDGDLLMNGTGRGTLGRAAAYLDQDRAVPDNHVTILRSEELDPVFLALYINSVAGQLQVEMHQRGTSGQLELYPNDIKKMLVWNAPKQFQQEIRGLYDTGAEAAKESQLLLDKAKARVESEIKKVLQQ